MNTDDLRNDLADDARHQPPVAAGFETGVARRVRRRRLQTAALAVPLVALAVGGAALIRVPAAPDATLATADASAASGTTVPGTAPATSAAPTTVPAPPATDPSAPAPGATTTVAPAPTPAGGDCGTVTVDGATAAKSMPDTGPFTCFINAFNANQSASMGVVATMPNSGSLTNRITTDAGHVMTVSVDGTMTMKLPAFLGNGKGGTVSGDPAGGSKDCGTVTMSTAAMKPVPGSDIAPGADKSEVQCLVQALLAGDAARLTMVVTGDLGGSITSVVDIGADHAVSVTTNGTVTVQAPADLKVPEDVLQAIPAAGTGLSGVPGLGGLGGPGASYGGKGGFGHK